MQAIRIHEHGDRSVIRIDTVEKPALRPDEVLVKTKSTALNHLDIWVREGLPGVPLPLIMGSDGAGTIVETGGLVKQDFSWKDGDEVFVAPIRSCGHCAHCLGGADNLCADFHIPGESMQGTMAEFVAAPAKYILPKPEKLNWHETAAFPLAAMTAYHMLIRKVQMQYGDWVLVYGASSGVGSAAIQIAKAFGARVISTAGSSEKSELAKKLGADHVLNYKNDPVGKSVKEITNGRGVDIVFEHTGARTWADSLRALKKGGKLVTCGATTGPKVQIDLRVLFIKHQQLIGSTMGTLRDLLDLLKLIENGKFKPPVSKVFGYEQIREAHQYLEAGGQFGKVVVDF